MSLTKENNLLVQKYKIAFEEHKIIKNKFDEGVRDLNAHLYQFQKKLSKKIKNQEERFKKSFFEIQENNSNSTEDVDEKSDSKNSQSGKSKPRWVKKAYREIVMTTHPDKTGFIPVKSVREKLTNYYTLSVESYDSSAFENLIFVANDLGIEINDEVVFDIVNPKLEKILKETQRIKNTNGYSWANIKEEEKHAALERYLQNLGFVFEKEEVNEVIEKVKRIKRKTGTKPIDFIRKRLKT